MKMNQDNQFYGSVQAAKQVGISLRQLYHWVDVLHVVNPKIQRFGLRQFRRFTSNDLEVLSKVKGLLEHGYTLRAAAEMVKS